MARYVVATTSEIAPGQRKIVQVGGREVGVFNIGSEFYALMNRCPHEGAALCKGQITGLAESDMPGTYRLSKNGEMVRCPWHGWLFDIKTGQSWCDPLTYKVRSIPVRVESAAELERGPFHAETVPVIIENNTYVVLDM